MQVHFAKYHALMNDFLVVSCSDRLLRRIAPGELARVMCNRRTGVGADGLLCLTDEKSEVPTVDVFNADGSWAEKSGNGLRIAAGHVHFRNRRRRRFAFEMNDERHEAQILGRRGSEVLIRTGLGWPEFEAARVPVRTALRYMINAPLELGGVEFPVTCLSVGNPHTVLIVDDFDFDWRELGAEIEVHPMFPHRTNVEFVKVLSRKKIKVADWERGAGATGSSGTGAAAAVCGGVMLGLVDRECEVEFETGALRVKWNLPGNEIELIGPVVPIAGGEYTLS